MEALMAAGAPGGSRVAAVTEQGLIDEQDWLERAQQADTAAFELLYRLHVDRVYGLCLRMTGNASEAEDCTQEAFIQAWNKLSKFRGDSAFSTWIHRIAVNSVLNALSLRRNNHISLPAPCSPIRKGSFAAMWNNEVGPNI